MRDNAAQGTAGRMVVFVCPHGAGKSRIGAAWFNQAAPPGWRATSAGLQPQAMVSAYAPRLLAGTPAAGLLDGGLPRSLAAVAHPDLVVAIDCSPDAVPGRALLDAGQPALRRRARCRAAPARRDPRPHAGDVTGSAKATGPAGGQAPR